MDFQKKGREYEKQLAKEYGGKTSPGSGNHWAAKSDITAGKFLLEVKHTTTGKYTLKSVDLNNLTKYAIRRGLIPAFQIGYYGKGEVVVLTNADFHHISEAKEVELKLEGKGKSSISLTNEICGKICTINYSNFDLISIPKSLFKELLTEN